MMGADFPKYVSIEPLYKVKDLLDLFEVVVTEKVHGVNIRFGFVGERFYFGGRNQSSASEKFNFMGFEEKTDEIKEALIQNDCRDIVFFGEWYGPKIQKGINYGGDRKFIIFDAQILPDGKWLKWDSLVQLCDDLGFETVPELYRGKPDIGVFEQLRNSNSIVSQRNGVEKATILEGIVIKTPINNVNEFGERYIAKYKNDKFSEVAKERKPNEAHVISVDAQQFVEHFVTQERMIHVLSSLREQNKDITNMSIMSDLIPAMIQDLNKELSDKIADLGANAKQIGKLVPAHLRRLLTGYLMSG